jgi:sugar phosphate permease
MWELYTFWAFLPLIITTYNTMHPVASLHVPLLSFMVIASGGVACAYSGWLSQKRDTKSLAAFFLSLSGACCLLSPLLLLVDYPAVFMVFLFTWGMSVVADSPLFSTLVAQAAPETSRGTALTIVNCIGFSITIVSIQIIGLIMSWEPGIYIFTLLALGPLFGLLKLYRSR